MKQSCDNQPEGTENPACKKRVKLENMYDKILCDNVLATRVTEIVSPLIFCSKVYTGAILCPPWGTKLGRVIKEKKKQKFG